MDEKTVIKLESHDVVSDHDARIGRKCSGRRMKFGKATTEF